MSYLDEYKKATGRTDPEPKPEAQPSQNPKRIITPSNHEGSGYILDYVEARKLQDRYAVIPSIQSGKNELWDLKRGYWENPYRVARYHNFIRNAPPDWEPPEWMNVPNIEAAYKYFGEQNKTSDWTKWKYLSENDPATYFLRNEMKQPPPEFLFPEEAEEVMQQEQINTWDELYPYQQTYESIMVPQPLGVDDGTDRPWQSKLIANTARSGLQAAAGAGIGAGIMKIAAMIGIAAGSTTAVIPAVVGAAFFVGSMYQSNTGKKLPIIGDMLEWLGVAGKPAEFTEKVIGAGEQVLDNDLTTILDNWGPAWDASGANYETNARNLLMDLWTKGATAIGAEGASEEMLTDPGEVYRWDLGLPDPQRLPEGYETGVDALNDMRVMIASGADPITVVEDYKAQFGVQGITNDFILQNILDPLNYVPTITQAAGRKYAKVTNNAALLASFDKITPTNVIVDGLPMPLNYLVTGMSGGKLQGAAGIMDGVLKYKSFIETGQFPGYKGTPEDFIPPKDYTQAQKTLGDLTDEGLPRTYMPDDPQSGVKGLFAKIKNLTPASKAEISYANLSDHIDVLMTMAGDDIGMVVKMLKTASEIDSSTTGKAFDQIVNPEGMSGSLLEPQNFITPIGTALAEGLKKLETNKLVDGYYKNRWLSSQDRRVTLYKLAEMLEIKPGEMLDQLFNKEFDIAGALKKKATELEIKDFEGITNDALKEQMGVFVGEDPLPIHPDIFKAELSHKIKTNLAEFMAARFGLKQDSKFMRFTHILKDIQSLLVLGFNPGYMVNNLVNNMMTRAADGIFGVMTRTQINDIMTRLEINPTRADMGFDDSSLAKEAFGITSEGKVTRVSEVVKAEKDLISAAGKVVKDVRNKVGIFSNLSAIIERSESKQAYISALRHMQSNLWRRDVAIRPLPDNLKQALGEDITTRLYEIAEKSVNPKEVDANFYGKGQPTVTEMLQRILDAFEGRNQNLTGNQDMYRELLSSTGILDDLDIRLKGAKNIQDIDNAFVEVQGTFENKIREMLVQEIETNIEAKKVLVQSEGITAAIAEFTDVEMEFMRTWITHFNELEDLYSRQPSMEKGEFNRQYKMLKQRDDARFTRLFDWEGSTTKGVLEALGFDEGVPSVKTILESHQEIATSWREFYKGRDDTYQKMLDEDYANSESYNIAKAEADKTVQELADAAFELEQNNYQKMNEAYISLSKNKELAREWREEVTAIRKDMIDGMKEFRKNLAEDPPGSLMERNYKWSEFIRKEYQPRIVALKSAEALIQKMNNTVLGDEGGLSKYIVSNPIDDTVPETLRTKIQNEAAAMLEELNEGQAGRRIPVEKEDSVTGRAEVTGMIAEPTTNVSWYRKLFKNNGGVNRSTVENALKYLAEGNTKSNQYTSGMKKLIIGRLIGYEPKGYDAGALEGVKNIRTGQTQSAANESDFTDMDIEATWLLGERDTAAWEMNDLINNNPDSIDGKFQDQTIRDKVYDYWANDWLAKNTVKEMFEGTGRYSDDQIVNIMSLYEFRAEQWARDTGNNPREWWNKYIREIKYADDPEQVMHELFQTGETSSTWYYSNLLRTIESMPNRMPADQMKGWLKGKVKKEEMGDTGFDQWIKEQDGMVEKSDALDFLSENAVRVEEIVFGAGSSEYISAKEELKPYLNRAGMAFQNLRDAYNNSPEVVEVSTKIANGEMTPEDFTNLPESVKIFAKEYESAMKAKAEYEKYLESLPGKSTLAKWSRPDLLTEGEHENYRELLLTLPYKPTIPEGARYVPEMAGDVWKIKDITEGSYLLAQGSTRREMGYITYEDAAAQSNRMNVPEGYKEVPYREDIGTFRSGHWSEPNVLAHIRYNDRVDVEGKKVLYIEEFQSDWHQAGRKKGYKDSLDTSNIIAVRDNEYENANADGAYRYAIKDKETNGLVGDFRITANSPGEALLVYAKEKNLLGVPNAPFKKSWNTLSMKRMIRWAVENGYDRVAWTPGEIQADRYSLAKYYETLRYYPGKEGSTHNKNGTLWMVSKDGKENSIELHDKNLKEYVGGELAEKMVSEEYNISNSEDMYAEFKREVIDIAKNNNSDIEEVERALDYLIEEPLGTDARPTIDEWMILNEATKGSDIELNQLHDIREDADFKFDPVYEISGDDLQVGGHGMLEFYDGIMVADTNKLIKKYGEKVGEVDIPTQKGVAVGLDEFAKWMNKKGYKESPLDEFQSGGVRLDEFMGENMNRPITVHSFDITDSMRQKAIEGLPLYQRDLDIYSLANKYGIATATADGKPNNKQLLNTINKYGDTKYKRLDEVPMDIAHKALEIRRIEKGDAPVKDALIRGAVSFDEVGAALMRLGDAADISTVVHETGHMFRRQLSGDDLEVIAKWTGLDSAEEMVKLEQQFDNSTIDDINRKRYIDSEEKFAEGFEKYLTTEHKNLPHKIQIVFARFAQWLMGVFNSLSKKHDVDINATVEVNGQQIRVKDVLDRMFVKLEGENPLGTTPQPMPQGKPLSEVADMYLYPLMDTAKDIYKRNHQSYKPFTVEGIPEQYRGEVKKWINGLKNDQASTKVASMKYAESKRDQALINYSRRTGLDEMLSVPFPYIFWYTKSMMNWATRMIDKPKLFATYARYRDMQEKMEREGIPSRMRGKMRLNAPYLPDWMGGGLWQDPMRQIFPFAQMMDPVDRASYMDNSLKHETYAVLNEMAEQGKITEEQAVVARESMSGELWDVANSEAADRVGTFDPMSLASIMASPAMYLTIPWSLSKGQPEKIQPTPFLKTTQAVETLTQNTILGGVGKMIGGIGDITEGALRRKAMTPAVAMFGEYGDYYVDRQLANMVADGEVSIEQARMAMVERTGEVYAAAVNRVREEVAMRIPGSAAVMAAKNGANIPQFAASVFHSLNPSGLLPTGELEYLNLKDDYSYAWDMYNKGYKDQLTQFFEDHPVFEARIAIKDDPDERMQNFLVSEIWDRYMNLDSANKQLARNQLGSQFNESFMGERVYDAIPMDKLALWAHMLGGMVPQVEGGPTVEGMPQVEQWSADAANAYQQYADIRDQQFPNWFAIEQKYFDLTRNKRRSYLANHPELKEYWDWKKEFRSSHPEMEPIMAYKSAQYQQENDMMKSQVLESMPEELTMQLQSYSLLGTNMGPGAWEALRYVWEKSGKPYGNLKKWVDEEAVSFVR